MAEFLVHFTITFPPGTDPVLIQRLYADERKAAQPYLDSGEFRRVWREAGTRNHWAHWVADSAERVHEAYASFPMWRGGYGTAQVIALAINPNDPGPDWPRS